jgi:DNA-binding transcriptional LysR family regulator
MQKSRGTSWDDTRIFLAVRRAGSHSAAGRSLGLNASTVGRRIAALEQALATRLFVRTPSGLALTRAGHLLSERAERVEAEMLAGERELRGTDERAEGKVRLTASDGLATYVLVPALRALRQRHPDMRVDLVADNRIADLSRREADVALRLVRPNERSLVARRIARLPFGLFGGLDYFARRPRPSSESELDLHDFIGYDESFSGKPLKRWLAAHAAPARVALRTNTTVALVAACAAGLGLAALPVPFAENERRLVRVFPDLVISTIDLWAVTHQDLRRNAAVVAVIAWLAEVVSPIDAAATRAR